MNTVISGQTQPGASLSLERLRRLTLSRATGTYWRWVERSIGWGTLIWMAFWLVFYAVAISQVIVFNVKPGNASNVPTVMVLLLGVGLSYTVLTRRTPPVILNRQDLYRLGLAPLKAGSVLNWEFTYLRGTLFAVGALIGAIWWLVAFAFFKLEPIFAPVALGLWFVATLDWGWLRYANFNRIWVFPALIVGGALLEQFTGFGVSSALWNANPLGLIFPAVAVILGIVWSRASLQGAYPPLFATHSLILSQLRAMNMTAVMVQRPPDPDVRRRLMQTLRQGSPALRPTRSLPVPRNTGPIGVIAWRVASTLYRRTFLEQLGFAVQIALLIAASASIIGGVAGTLLLMLALSVTVPRLLGPSFNTLPVDVPQRTLGRVLPGIAIIGVIALIAVIVSTFIPTIPSLAIIEGTLHALLALVALEKLSTRFKTPPSSRDVALLSAVVALLPEITLGIFGASGNTVTVQLGLLFLLLWQPFL